MKQYHQPHLIIYSESNPQNPIKLLQSNQEFSSYKLTSQNVINYNQIDLDLPIGKVRKLINESYLLNDQNKLKFLLIFYLDKASIPAQNALLKLTEEPPYNLMLIYFVKDESKILDTLKSRCLRTKITNPNAKDLTFIKNNLPLLNEKLNNQRYDKLNLDDYLTIEDFLKKSKKTNPELSDQKKVLIILEEITKNIHQNLQKQTSSNNIDNYGIIKKINQSHSLINRNLNAKLILFKLFFCLENKIPLLFDLKI
jgi:hypothetical protein